MENLEMTINAKRFRLAIGGLLLVVLILRIWLQFSPNSDFNVGSYNIHHLFTGLLLVTIGGLPLAFLEGRSRWLDAAALVFGSGLGMALDEWVYLIATDGTNASYLLPVSLWGAVVVIGLACIYAFVLQIYFKKMPRDR
jgi:hypothetical protein